MTDLPPPPTNLPPPPNRLPPPPTRTSAPSQGDLTDELISTDIWTDETVSASGIPIEDVELVSIGGGLGSFAMADMLRIGGLPTTSVRVLGTDTEPARTYRYLATNSQIPGHERLRSDASSTMDNIWGFPSYAFREARHGRTLSDKIQPLWNVFSEPVLSDFYTPRGDQVYTGVTKEAARIGWSAMLQLGLVRMVRRRHGGGYFTVRSPERTDEADGTKRVAVRSRFVHIAVGYPGVRVLPDLQKYRETYDDYSRVVNAYEPHDHVYAELRRRPSTVLVRGSGIVASRILQRLIEDRDVHGAQTQVIHLFRNYVSGPQGTSATSRRPGGDGFAYQGFNFPKSAWGGQLKDQLERLDDNGRKELLGQWGGTNTPKRRDWQEQLRRGRQQGFYIQQIGTVADVVPADGQSITTVLRSTSGEMVDLTANFIIDATGLESDISEHRLLSDLLDHSAAGRNGFGRLATYPTFEVAGTRSEPGRMYASGSATLGGYYAGVDSFLGLQYAALQIADDLASIGFGRRIGTTRSISEWWRWMRNRPPADLVRTPTPGPNQPGVPR